ncbi:Uncharacterised protein [Burkholderia pseudomallei]|nr:Uncharacterised protein [Burkholderia pseudomallei]VCJ93261.1 Uncharacterised protein [Burkholderia pseudomallei]VCJ94840.1 Uncharacterised protein [Burkholderia pseudomallei]VCJ95782.1 Uncharacterised protein [Burkholderia pseudomallei]VCJ97283.1 Uncharacterised protein [Burkholderia pseudomallei]
MCAIRAVLAAGTCKVIWRSDDFAEKTRFEKGTLIMGTNQVRVDRRCRPAP